jgi:hypothetical protein
VGERFVGLLAEDLAEVGDRSIDLGKGHSSEVGESETGSRRQGGFVVK